MRARLRRDLLAIVAVFLVILAVRGVAAAWAVISLQRYEDERLQGVARGRDLADGPAASVPGGQHATGEEACWHRKMLKAVEGVHRAVLVSRKDIIVEAAGAGRVQLPHEAEDAASACAVISRALKVSTRTDGCAWDYHGLRGGEGSQDPDSLALARAAAGCLVIEGNRLLASGDVQAAADRYVLTLRIAADLRQGDLAMYISGLSIGGMAVERLAELMSSSGTDGIGLYIPDALPALAPSDQELEGLVETERWRGWARRSAYEMPERFVDDGSSWTGLKWKGIAILITRKAIGAYFLTSRREAVFRALARAVTIKDPKEAAVQLSEVVESAQGISHPLIGTEVAPWARVRVSHDDLLARFRVLAAAARLEGLWAQAGSYPREESALELPVDPFAFPRAIQYQRLAQGGGYRLWSIGPDLVDDHGRSGDRKDLVFERSSH